MERLLGCRLAAVGIGVAALLSAGSAAAQKQGGTLRVYHPDSPPSMSVHEEVTISTNVPKMGVFNNLVVYDQHVTRPSGFIGELILPPPPRTPFVYAQTWERYGYSPNQRVFCGADAGGPARGLRDAGTIASIARQRRRTRTRPSWQISLTSSNGAIRTAAM
jgi:hypothetical protein